MKKLVKVIAVITLLMSLFPILVKAQPSLSSPQNLEKYRALAAGKIGETLLDPYSAVYVFQKIVVFENGSGLICGTVNAKNRFGGYVGAKEFLVMLEGERVNTATVDDEEGSWKEIIQAFCSAKEFNKKTVIYFEN